MKKNINITIDEELYSYLKEQGKPISTTINELLFKSFSPKDSTKEEEKTLIEELTLAKKFNLDEREFFLIKDNFNKNIMSFWRLNKGSFTNIKSIYELIELRKEFEPLWAKEDDQKTSPSFSA